MKTAPLYPLRFVPLFQKRIWGGRRLEEWLGPLPDDGPVGEAWVLSDQGDHQSRVAEGPLQGRTLRQLMEQVPEELLGNEAKGQKRFPLLLKFLDARDTLSVQVHPDDRHTHLLPPGQRGKTEAWVVLQAEPASRIYAGLRPGTGPEELRRALRQGKVADCLASFTPRVGDCVFLPAGTVHALGGGLVIFEVQQNSDVTFRLYDWDRVDSQTGKPRQLHIEESMACTDFAAPARGPVQPVVEQDMPVRRERLIGCEHFQMRRWQADRPFTVGAARQCRILVGIAGQLSIEHGGALFPMKRGDVLLLPAAVGACSCHPIGRATVLECGLAETVS